jgi:MFS family permease
LNRGVVAGCALGVASGWNFGNVGAIASELAGSYGVGLAAIGLLTTALVVTHLAIQIPGGRASDRFGPARAGAAALAVIGLGNAVALISPALALGIAGRAVAGVGTGVAFIAGSALVRESGGSPFAQGVFGGIGLGAGGVALGIVPQLEGAAGWRAPFWSALAIAGAIAALVLATRTVGAARRATPPARGGVLRDRRLYRLALLYSVSYGLGVVLASWVVELLQRHSTLSDGASAGVGSLTLLLVVVSRPLGGWLLRAHPARARLTVAGSILAGSAGTLALVAATPVPLAVLGALLVGIAAGLPFAPAFTGAALVRPDAPAAAVAVINSAANLVVLVGTPLVGLTFALPGGGRIGFAGIAAAWLAGLLFLPSARALGVRPAGTPASP